MQKMELQSCLGFTPFDNKVASIFGNEADKEEAFFQYLFEPYNDKYYGPLKRRLDEAIQTDETRFIQFVGPAGTGKTTFLHYYFRSYPQNNNVNYKFINLVEFPSTSLDDDILKRSLCNYIDTVLDEEVINRFIDKYIESGGHMPILVKEGQVKDKELLNFLFRRKFEKRLSALVGLMNYYNPFQLASIFVILSIYKNLGTQKQNVFIFDNVDELSSTYIGKQFVSFVLDVFSVVQEYFERIDTSFFETGSPFINHCSFIIVLRAINAKLLGESQQHNERVRAQTVRIEFNPYMYSYPKMIRKRIDYYTGISHNDETDNRLAFRRYCQMVADENSYIVSHVEPLLNFDRRILTRSFSGIFNRDTWFKNLAFLPNGIGGRGAIILNTLDFLYHENNNSSQFSTYLQNDIKSYSKDEVQKCNIHRMCFTLLSNLSGVSSIEKKERHNILNDENEFYEHLEAVKLDLFIKKIKQWYPDEEIGNALSTLISISSSNYEVPVFLEGDVVDKFTDAYYKKKGADYSTPSYVHALVDYVMKMPDTAKQSVSIKINPLCVIYPYHIFIHFEYYNVQSYYALGLNKGGTLKALFLIDEIKELKSCLERVWSAFEKMQEGMQTHFCSRCRDGCNKMNCQKQLSEFKKDQFCFNRALYSTRSISSIVNYLDSYRVYMWERANFDGEIQTMLINEIKKYIAKYWGKKVQDDSANEKMSEIERNLREIEQTGNYSKPCMPDTDNFGVN